MLPFASHEWHLLFASHEARRAAQSVQSFSHRDMWSATVVEECSHHGDGGVIGIEHESPTVVVSYSGRA